MPRHPSVPASQTGWVPLGTVSTDTAMIAIVAPELAATLGDQWTARYLDDDGEPREPGPAQEHDLIEFEEVPVGDQDHAVLLAVHCDGGYLVEGKFADTPGGGAELTEVRIRLWACTCTCHDSDAEPTCEGDCHDDDPGEPGSS